MFGEQEPQYSYKGSLQGTDFSPAQLAFLCNLVARGKDVCPSQYLGCPHAEECERVTEAHWQGLLLGENE